MDELTVKYLAKREVYKTVLELVGEALCADANGLAGCASSAKQEKAVVLSSSLVCATRLFILIQGQAYWVTEQYDKDVADGKDKEEGQ